MEFLVIFMLCRDDSSCYVEIFYLFFFMVCGDGCILRTHGVIGKGVVMLSFDMLSLVLGWFHFYVMVYT